eukprot:114449-Prymnesium_polylepis.1
MGSYDRTDSYSAQMRIAGHGVLSMDADEVTGGGSEANMLNPACFDFLVMMVESKQVIGGVSHEPCGSGSV